MWRGDERHTSAICWFSESLPTSRGTLGTRSCARTPTTEPDSGGRSYGRRSRWWGSPGCRSSSGTWTRVLRYRRWRAEAEASQRGEGGRPSRPPDRRWMNSTPSGTTYPSLKSNKVINEGSDFYSLSKLLGYNRLIDEWANCSGTDISSPLYSTNIV